jgi:hypothetical protein
MKPPMSAYAFRSFDDALTDLSRDVDVGRVQPFGVYASRVAPEDLESLREEYGVAVGLWTASERSGERCPSSRAAPIQEADRIERD